MYRAAARPSSRRDTALFAGCVALSLLLLFIPTAWTGAFADSARETALRPVLWLQRRGAEGRTSRARLEAALATRDSAVMAASAAEAAAHENERLRALLDLRSRAPLAFLTAEVLHQPLPTDGRTLLLGVGTGDGAAQFQPVIAAEGLVGVIGRVGPTTSVVTTWAHPEFRASAVTENGEVLGIVAPVAGGDPGLGLLEFRGVAYRDTVPDHSVVVTSGLGGVYPRGLPIGRILGVRREELGWERVYRLIPFVNLGVVGQVLLLHPPEAEAALHRDSLP